MSRASFVSSAVMHGLVLALMALDFSFARFDKTPPSPALLMVDLSKVKISDKTNLPPKVSPKKETKVQKATQSQTKEISKTKTTIVQKQEKTPPKPKPQTPVKNSAQAVETKKKSDKKINKKTPPVKAPSADDKLKSLLASVNKVSKKAPAPSSTKIAKEEMMTEGIEGGTSGDISKMLTVSERDLIATQLSKCWLVDSGKNDIENMIVEIKAEVNRDGSIKSVEILNKPSDPVKRSVAESARRAVLVCDSKKELSPFKILAEKYADHYSDWKSVRLRFNPLTGGIM